MVGSCWLLRRGAPDKFDSSGKHGHVLSLILHRLVFSPMRMRRLSVVSPALSRHRQEAPKNSSPT